VRTYLGHDTVDIRRAMDRLKERRGADGDVLCVPERFPPFISAEPSIGHGTAWAHGHRSGSDLEHESHLHSQFRRRTKLGSWQCYTGRALL